MVSCNVADYTNEALDRYKLLLLAWKETHFTSLEFELILQMLRLGVKLVGVVDAQGRMSTYVFIPWTLMTGLVALTVSKITNKKTISFFNCNGYTYIFWGGYYQLDILHGLVWIFRWGKGERSWRCDLIMELYYEVVLHKMGKESSCVFYHMCWLSVVQLHSSDLLHPDTKSTQLENNIFKNSDLSLLLAITLLFPSQHDSFPPAQVDAIFVTLRDQQDERSWV